MKILKCYMNINLICISWKLARRRKYTMFFGKFILFPKKISSWANVAWSVTDGRGSILRRSVPIPVCLVSALLFLHFFLNTPLRDVLLIAPAYYRTHCACFFSLCALLWGASLGRGFRYKFWRILVRGAA